MTMETKPDHTYGWRVTDVNANGLTWPQWFYAAGFKSYSVDANWTPVLSEHDSLFDAWKAGEDPSDWRAGK